MCIKSLATFTRTLLFIFFLMITSYLLIFFLCYLLSYLIFCCTFCYLFHFYFDCLHLTNWLKENSELSSISYFCYHLLVMPFLNSPVNFVQQSIMCLLKSSNSLQSYQFDWLSLVVGLTVAREELAGDDTCVFDRPSRFGRASQESARSDPMNGPFLRYQVLQVAVLLLCVWHFEDRQLVARPFCLDGNITLFLLRVV